MDIEEYRERVDQIDAEASLSDFSAWVKENKEKLQRSDLVDELSSGNVKNFLPRVHMKKGGYVPDPCREYVFYFPEIHKPWQPDVEAYNKEHGGAICCGCGEWKPDKYLLKKDTGNRLRLCKVCQRLRKQYDRQVQAEIQDLAVRDKRSTALDSELSNIVYVRVKQGKKLARYDKEGHEYTRCLSCHVWKPRSTYFFPKVSNDPKKPFRILNTCRLCKGSLNTVRKAERKKVRSKAIKHTSYILYKVGVGRLRKEFIAIYAQRLNAYTEMKKRALKEDPYFSETGMSKMFKVEKVEFSDCF